MKKFFKKAGQVFTGAAAAVTLMAGRVMAAEAGGASNPAQAGANTAKGYGRNQTLRLGAKLEIPAAQRKSY